MCGFPERRKHEDVEICRKRLPSDIVCRWAFVDCIWCSGFADETGGPKFYRTGKYPKIGNGYL